METDVAARLIEESLSDDGDNEGFDRRLESGDLKDTWQNQISNLEFLQGITVKLDESIQKSQKSIIAALEAQKDAISIENGSPSEKELELQREVSTNAQCLEALNNLWILQSGLQEARSLSEFGELRGALDSLTKVEAKVKEFQSEYPGLVVTDEIISQVSALNKSIETKTRQLWSEMISFNETQPGGGCTLSVKTEYNNGEYTLAAVVEALEFLDSSKIGHGSDEMLLRELESRIFNPIMDRRIVRVDTVEESVVLEAGSKDRVSMAILFDNLISVIKFLNERLLESEQLLSRVKRRFAGYLITRLQTDVLSSYFPDSPSGLDAFKNELSNVESFEDFLIDASWSKSRQLQEWVEHSPSEWVTFRKSLYLDKIRNVLTQKISLTTQVDSDLTNGSNKDKNEPEGWDWNEDGAEDGTGDDDNWDAWDDDKDSVDSKAADSAQANVALAEAKVAGNSVSLSENTTQNGELSVKISSIPAELFEIISEFINDTSNVSGNNNNRLIRSVSDFVALYRALGSDVYRKHAPNAIIAYNDGNLIRKELQQKFPDYCTDYDLSVLETFSNRQLSTLLLTEQQILQGELEKTSGFVECSEDGPNFANCGIVVESMLRQLKNLKIEWIQYTSYLVTFQLLGSLVELVVSSYVASVEGQSDIAELECNGLVKLHDRLATMEHLFVLAGTKPKHDEAGDGRVDSLVASYVPSWIKFQYFGEILRSTNMSDIYFLLESNSLVDFSSLELVSLIRALYADSDKRKNLLQAIMSRKE